MFVSRDREKLLNAIIYFLGATNHCHTLKLFKLLNFADFEHFRQTGRTIFNLDYRALPKGPVPTKLFDEIKRGGDADLKSAVAIHKIKDDINDALLRRDLKAKSKFDKQYFSKRELQIIETVAEFFRDLKAEDMSEFSHRKGEPWRTTYGDKGQGSGKLISPDLILNGEALLKDSPTISRDELEDRRELLKGIA
ncbi:putative phage-associated protein [Bradyrhizobium sp. USDA 377]